MQRRLLAVLAHPDDESFGLGGTLAKYAGEGVDVHVAIATDGTAGSVIEEFTGRQSQLHEIRRAELEAASDVLGVTLHRFDYPDSGYLGDPRNEDPRVFANMDAREPTARVVRLIRELRPQVVITHDETGGYLHPDHIKAHEITRAAFFAAGDPNRFPEIAAGPYQPQRLFYTAFPRRWVKPYLLLSRLRGEDPTRMGRNEDIDITKLGRPTDDIDVGLNIFHYWDKKQEASAQHRSQGGGSGSGFANWLPQWIQRRLLSTEYFIRAYPAELDGASDRDLFAGIEVGRDRP